MRRGSNFEEGLLFCMPRKRLGGRYNRRLLLVLSTAVGGREVNFPFGTASKCIGKGCPQTVSRSRLGSPWVVRSEDKKRSVCG